MGAPDPRSRPMSWSTGPCVPRETHAFNNRRWRCPGGTGSSRSPCLLCLAPEGQPARHAFTLSQNVCWRDGSRWSPTGRCAVETDVPPASRACRPGHGGAPRHRLPRSHRQSVPRDQSARRRAPDGGRSALNGVVAVDSRSRGFSLVKGAGDLSLMSVNAYSEGVLTERM